MRTRSFGQRLKLVRAHYKITITEMADKLRIVKSNVSRYERDLNKPTIGFIELLLKHYRVNLNWLFGEQEDMLLKPKDSKNIKQAILSDTKFSNKQNLVEYTSFRVPVYSGEKSFSPESSLLPIAGSISAGEPMEIKDEGYDFVPFPFYKTQKDLEKYLVFRVNGLSMSPDIHHEDIIFIYKNDNWLELNERVVAIMIHGEMTLKKLIINYNKNEVIFKALNEDYKDISLDFTDMGTTYLLGELKAIRRIYK